MARNTLDFAQHNTERAVQAEPASGICTGR
jgi:hypothetical protein